MRNSVVNNPLSPLTKGERKRDFDKNKLKKIRDPLAYCDWVPLLFLLVGCGLVGRGLFDDGGLLLRFRRRIDRQEADGAGAPLFPHLHRGEVRAELRGFDGRNDRQLHVRADAVGHDLGAEIVDGATGPRLLGLEFDHGGVNLAGFERRAEDEERHEAAIDHPLAFPVTLDGTVAEVRDGILVDLDLSQDQPERDVALGAAFQSRLVAGLGGFDRLGDLVDRVGDDRTVFLAALGAGLRPLGLLAAADRAAIALMQNFRFQCDNRHDLFLRVSVSDYCLFRGKIISAKASCSALK